ncbi:MAG: hypothetical protein ACPGID_08665 [Rubricella sp.]
MARAPGPGPIVGPTPRAQKAPVPRDAAPRLPARIEPPALHAPRRPAEPALPAADPAPLPSRVHPASRPDTATEFLRLGSEASQVMFLRLSRFSVLPGAMPENTRMVAEKPAAFADALWEGSLALLTGHRPDEAARRSAARLREVTSANLRRLTE